MLLSYIESYLRRPEAVKSQILAAAFIIGVYQSIRTDHRSYGRALAGPAPDPAPTSSSNKKSSEPTLTSARSPSLGRHLKWREFPARPKVFVMFRRFANLWMSYVVVKFLFSKQIGQLIGVFVQLELPIHCYLMGRYILHESVAELTGAFFSAMFLFWRYVQLTAKPYRMNLLYYLILDPCDRETALQALESGQSVEMSLDELAQLSPHERLLLDAMCYRVVRPARVVFRLRANRTRASYRKLSRLLARLTLGVLAVLLSVGSLLTVLHSFLRLLDARYLSVYPNCDPQLEQLSRAGQLGPWSVSLRWHHLATILVDQVENLCIWLESGLIATLAPACVHLFNYDLLLHWRGIARKIRRLEAMFKGEMLLMVGGTGSERRRASVSMARPSRLVQQQLSYELAAEVGDFFDQLDRVGELLSLFLNATVIGCLSLCALYTYFLQTRSVHQLPAPVTALLLFLAAALIFGCHSFLMVHKSCTRSYTSLCSLMAYNQMKHTSSYGMLIEFYAKRRDCFLIMRQFRFQTTTLLTLIGWTFSCFCIITEVLHRDNVPRH